MPKQVEEYDYYVWRSDLREVCVVRASSAKVAAHAYAINNRIPFNIALRVVWAENVSSFGIRVVGVGDD